MLRPFSSARLSKPPTRFHAWETAKLGDEQDMYCDRRPVPPKCSPPTKSQFSLSSTSFLHFSPNTLHPAAHPRPEMAPAPRHNTPDSVLVQRDLFRRDVGGGQASVHL